MSIKFQGFCRGRYKLAAACIDEIWGLVPSELQPRFLSVIHRMHSAVAPLNNVIPDHIKSLDAAIKAQEAEPPEERIGQPHADDIAVDQFARRMKWTLCQARGRGRSGWQDRSWTPEQISQALREHVEKGDPMDVANYCMFLAARNEPITKPAQPSPEPAEVICGTKESLAALGISSKENTMSKLSHSSDEKTMNEIEDNARNRSDEPSKHWSSHEADFIDSNLERWEMSRAFGAQAVIHDSDCALHNGPAYPPGPCNCSISANKSPEPPDGYMCPNCVTPWKCNGPHIPEPASEPQGDAIDIVFDGPPGPEAGRFVEVENAQGQSIRFGGLRGEGMSDDPIVGHKTLRNGRHIPLRQSEADEIMERIDADEAKRAADMPDEKAAINAMFQAYLRLKELGWREAQYCPKDGSTVLFIEAGSTGFHNGHYDGEWPKGYFWLHEDGDLWPSRPILFKAKQK